MCGGGGVNVIVVIVIVVAVVVFNIINSIKMLRYMMVEANPFYTFKLSLTFLKDATSGGSWNFRD